MTYLALGLAILLTHLCLTRHEVIVHVSRSVVKSILHLLL